MSSFRIGYIYLITNKVNGKQYVGQTLRTVDKRWKLHCYNARFAKYRHGVLSRAIHKYGAENFDVKMLQVCTEPLLNFYERHFIAAYGCMSPHGYNLTSGGDSGGTASAETRRRQSNALKGIPRTQEWKDGISAGNKGKPKSDEHRASLRRAHADPSKYVLSTETKAYIAKCVGDAARGKHRTPAEKAILSKAHKGIALSTEHREKVSAANKLYWAQLSDVERTAKTRHLHTRTSIRKREATLNANPALRRGDEEKARKCSEASKLMWQLRRGAAV